MFRFLQKFKYFDIPLQVSILLLLISGLVVLYSTSLSSDNLEAFWRQLAFLGLGLLAFYLFSFFDYHALAKAHRFFYPLLIAALLYLLVFGDVIRGGRRWIDFGLFRFQLAEAAKLAVILGLARILHLKMGQINSWKSLGSTFLYTIIPAGLVILEPDMGSALIILSLWSSMLLISPIKKKFLVILLALALATGGASWKFFLKDFQKDRIMVFLKPDLDPRGRGYNVRQATIAVGSGEMFGRGIGKGIQSQHKFLPERQTDFIFAAASEEIGFVGCMVLLLMYWFLFMRLIKITRSARDDLGMYLTAGVFFLLFWHVLINIGMNIGLLPVTGIPLPFISSGGSSLVVMLAALGIVQNISMQSKILRF